jgi:hypothetical protein
MVSKFFRRVARHFANEVAVVTPNGRLLAHDLAAGLKAWKALPAADRKRLDDLGTIDTRFGPAPPAGGLVIKVYARGLRPDGGKDGALTIYRTEVARSREPGRDHLWLSAGECKALLPERPEKGKTQPLPAAVAQRICRCYLIDLVRVGGNGGPRRPEQVLARDLRLTVEKVSAGRVRLRLHGSARVATHDAGAGGSAKKPKVDTYTFLGFVEHDAKKKAFTRFDVVALSETGHYDEVHKKVLPLGFAFELAPAKAPADRAPPSCWSKDYFPARRTGGTLPAGMIFCHFATAFRRSSGSSVGR